MSAKVRKAVFPAAGLGTRFLPATKASPKEMLPVVDKPLIQYGVEEALASGADSVIIVTARGKTSIEDHFDTSYELEQVLGAKKKTALLALARQVASMANISYVRQREALGLGHAVLQAKELVGNEPFSVILSDDIIAADTPCVRQLADAHAAMDGSVIALMEVPRDQISSYGCVAAEPVSDKRFGDRLFKITDMVEKPKPEEAPSNLAIIGRYVLTPDIFGYIETLQPGSGGELQLTDALKAQMQNRPVYGLKFEGKRYDAGDKAGFLKATVEFALNRPDLGPAFREYLKNLAL
ncbi:MAG: UTP--glucose-1-phosphate uridylyltransferase GalU [Rhodospirillales bacterium]|nr:UTP--glucose-1-phosphate uridylyltransferase GalU [Acetobacter sp.]